MAKKNADSRKLRIGAHFDKSSRQFLLILREPHTFGSGLRSLPMRLPWPLVQRPKFNEPCVSRGKPSRIFSHSMRRRHVPTGGLKLRGLCSTSRVSRPPLHGRQSPARIKSSAKTVLRHRTPNSILNNPRGVAGPDSRRETCFFEGPGQISQHKLRASGEAADIGERAGA